MVTFEASVASNLARLQDTIAATTARVGRSADEVTLVGISKVQPAEAVAAAVRAGIQHIGENRVQEAAIKFPRVRELLHDERMPVCHMVGHLQTNKASSAVELFGRIDSVDSVKLAQALSRRAAADVPVLVEVYVGSDPARPGIRLHEAEEVVGRIAELPRLRIEGLMTVAPLGEDARAAFAKVRELRIQLARTYPRVHFGVLSMGMSEDFQIAIEEGSTEVRIGAALFGPRQLR